MNGWYYTTDEWQDALARESVERANDPFAPQPRVAVDPNLLAFERGRARARQRARDQDATIDALSRGELRRSRSHVVGVDAGDGRTALSVVHSAGGSILSAFGMGDTAKKLEALERRGNLLPPAATPAHEAEHTAKAQKSVLPWALAGVGALFILVALVRR